MLRFRISNVSALSRTACCPAGASWEALLANEDHAWRFSALPKSWLGQLAPRGSSKGKHGRKAERPAKPPPLPAAARRGEAVAAALAAAEASGPAQQAAVGPEALAEGEGVPGGYVFESEDESIPDEDPVIEQEEQQEAAGAGDAPLPA